MDTGNLSEKEFRIMVVKMIQNLGRTMEVQFQKIKELLSKDLEELKKSR